MNRRLFIQNLSALAILGLIRPGETISHHVKLDEKYDPESWPKMTIRYETQEITLNIINGDVNLYRLPPYELETFEGIGWIEPENYSWGVDVELKLSESNIDNLINIIGAGNICNISIHMDKYTECRGNVIAYWMGDKNNGLAEIEFKGCGAMEHNYNTT